MAVGGVAYVRGMHAGDAALVVCARVELLLGGLDMQAAQDLIVRQSFFSYSDGWDWQSVASG